MTRVTVGGGGTRESSTHGHGHGHGYSSGYGHGGGVSGAKTVVVLDNGAGWCKAGFAGQDAPDAVVPNCMVRPHSGKRWLVADQVLQCDEVQRLGIRRAMDRGYLISHDLEKEIWDRILRTVLKVRPSEAALLLVEPLFTLPSIKKSTDELIFEEFGFRSLFVADSPSLSHLYFQHRNSSSSFIAKSRCSLVVDCGFSFTHAAPVVDNFTCNSGVKRIDLGGKALTNYLKELVSYRTVNMLDETWIMEDVKEKLCYCSLDVAADMDIARKSGSDNFIRCHYVLPDGVQNKRGVVKDPDSVKAAYRHLPPEIGNSQGKGVLKSNNTPGTGEEVPATKDVQELVVTNERFLVPEMLFHPADLGMNQAGLAECIVRAVNSCHRDLHPLLYSSVILTGGSTKFPGFKERLEMELRPLVPAEYDLHFLTADDPTLTTWRGGSLLARNPSFESWCVTKAEYEELGSYRCRRRFMNC